MSWIDICAVTDIPERGARIVKTAVGCVAIFRTGPAVRVSESPWRSTSTRMNDQFHQARISDPMIPRYLPRMKIGRGSGLLMK